MKTTGLACFIAMTVGFGMISCAPQSTEPSKPAPAAKKQAAPETSPAPPKKKPRLNGRGKVSSISVEDFFVLQQSGSVLLYDARPAFFYKLGHIPGAISMPKNRSEWDIPAREAEIKVAIAAKKTIVVYCTNFACPDARTVARRLAGYGYSSSTLTGGWDSWKDAGLPTE